MPAPQAPVTAQVDPTGNGRTESRRIDLTWEGLIEGCMEYIKATIPETTGAAIEVPSESR